MTNTGDLSTEIFLALFSALTLFCFYIVIRNAYASLALASQAAAARRRRLTPTTSSPPSPTPDAHVPLTPTWHRERGRSTQSPITTDASINDAQPELNDDEGLDPRASPGWSFRVWFHAALFFAAVARTGALTAELVYNDDEDGDSLTSYWTDIIHAFPSLLFFTTYSLLVLFWAQLVHEAASLSSTLYVWPFFVFLNCTAYIVFVAAAIFTADEHAYKPFSRVVLYVLGVVDLIACLGFAYYGSLIARALKSTLGGAATASEDGAPLHPRRFHSTQTEARARSIHCRIVSVCVVCTVTFLVRGVYSLLVSTDFIGKHYEALDLGHKTWDAFYYGAVEFVPSVITLALTMLRPSSKSAGSGSGSGTLSPAAEAQAYDYSLDSHIILASDEDDDDDGDFGYSGGLLYSG